MSNPKPNVAGHVYRCLVCGAEVSVIRGGEGDSAPRCCNEPMTLLPRLHRTYFCPVCGAEVMVIRQGTALPTPRCCNCPMIAREMAA